MHHVERMQLGWLRDGRLPGLKLIGTLSPGKPLEWVSAAVPAVTRAAVGAGHWAPGAGGGPWQRGQALLGTPTSFIDGVVHRGGYDPAALLTALARWR
jgi:hypothetical protein